MTTTTNALSCRSSCSGTALGPPSRKRQPSRRIRRRSSRSLPRRGRLPAASGRSRHLLLYPGATAEFADRSRRGTDQVFDNLYFIGDEGTLVYVLATSDGLVLIHSGYQNKVESVLLPGMKKLGLDPSQVKYVLVGHAHADHLLVHVFPGAVRSEGRPRCGGLGGPRPGGRFPSAERSEAAQAGHRQGQPDDPRRRRADHDCPSARTHARWRRLRVPGQGWKETRMAAMNAATILLLDNPRLSVATMQQYAEAIQNFKSVTTRMKVEVEVQNHPLFDDTFEKASRLATRKPGDPNPFVVGEAGYPAVPRRHLHMHKGSHRSQGGLRQMCLGPL